MRYTYTIFNADPDSSEEAEMPCLDNVVVSGDSAKDVAEQALREACGIARANAEHEPTDRLWVWVWNERGQIPFKTSCEVGNRPYKRRKFLDAIIGPPPGSPEHRQARKARLRREEKAGEFLDKWYCRYLGATLCLWGAWYLLHNHPTPAWEALGIWPSIILVIFAAILARELSICLIICGLVVWAFQALAALPVSLAIIIGAIIIGSYIANSLRTK